MARQLPALLLPWLALALVSCSTQTVKSTAVTPITTDSSPIAEEELLDVGVAIFDPGLDDIQKNREELTFSDVRMAETYYVSHLLTQTLQSSGNWGVVRVIPHDLSSTDLAVRGTILQSDGETMRLHVVAKDSTGRLWLDKEYEEVVSRYSYDPRLRQGVDAFQGMYNRIANDLLAYRQRSVAREDLLRIRTVSQIQFAKSFAPQVFDEYLEENRRGIIEVKRLPSVDDPILQRIESIRERDYLFVDALQDYYGNFCRQMETPYTEFRRLSYDEVMKLDQLKAESRRNMVLGAIAVLGGIAATQSSNRATLYSSPAIIASGAWLIREAFSAGDEAQMHVEVLAELGNSLELEIAPQRIELEERSITLTGSVEAQYAQWREILADIYANEIEGAASPLADTAFSE